MFTPERTALLVLVASLLVFAAVVMCSRSAVGVSIPMAADSLVVVTRDDTVAPYKPDRDDTAGYNQNHRRKSGKKGTKPTPPADKEKPQSPKRDRWSEVVPVN